MRTNGWQAPFHYLQVITWFFFPMIMALFFAFTTPLLEVSTAYIGSIAYGIVCIVVVYSVIRCTGTDPSDDSILQRDQDNGDQSTQVTDDQLYCNVCVQYVHKESRHCRLCDKCVSVFDHHCKWLNNCVGKKNYRFFLTSVVGATVMLALQVAFGVFVLSNTYSDDDTVRRRSASAYGCSEGLDKSTGFCIAAKYRVPLVAIRVIHAVLLVMLIPWCFLIAQLALFHFQLCIENITTYDYIVRKRKRKLQRERENTVRAPWWKLLYARLCCQRDDDADEFNKAAANRASERPSRASFDSETEEQAAIEAEVDEDLEVMSARSGDAGVRRGSMQIGKPEDRPQKQRGFGLHVNFNQDGSLESATASNESSSFIRTPTHETSYVAAPMTPRSPRSDPGSAYVSELSDGDRQSSVVIYGRPVEKPDSHVV